MYRANLAPHHITDSDEDGTPPSNVFDKLIETIRVETAYSLYV